MNCRVAILNYTTMSGNMQGGVWIEGRNCGDRSNRAYKHKECAYCKITHEYGVLNDM